MKKYLILPSENRATVNVTERHRAYRLMNPQPLPGQSFPDHTFHYFATCNHYPLALALFDDCSAGNSMRQEMAHDFAAHFIPLKGDKPWSITAVELLFFAAGWGAAVLSDRSMDGGLPPDPQMSEGGI